MKNLIVSTLFVMSSVSSFAQCDLETKIYKKESDNEGTNVSLSYECKEKSTQDVLCVYLGDSASLASITKGSGIYIGASELYSRSIKETNNSLSIKMRNYSFFDSKKVKFKLTKSSGEATFSIKTSGWSPYDGYQSDEENGSYTCKKN